MFNWLFGKTRFQFYEDSYARTRSVALEGMQRAIASRIENNDLFLIVAHFPNVFQIVQDNLYRWGFDYQIVTKPVSPTELAERFKNSQCQILLTLSDLLFAEQTAGELFQDSRRICVIGAERHPAINKDDALEAFCRCIPAYVEMGYFLSFEDVIIRDLVNESSLKILDMFGMGENELITSNMISRRLRTVLKQRAKHLVSNHRADSAEQWLQINDQTKAR